MQTPNDEQFELELKQFRPLDADPLPTQKPRSEPRSSFLRRNWAMAWVAAAAIFAVAAWLNLHRAPQPAVSIELPSRLAQAPPLTLGRSNTLLAEAPSFKAALDAMAFQTQPAPVAPDKRSVIAELSKERIKL